MTDNTAPQKSKGLSRTLVLLIGLVVVGAAVVMGVVVSNGERSGNANTNVGGANRLVNANAETTASLDEPVKEWTQYTNTAESYSISYPSNWVIREYQRSNPPANILKIASDERYPGGTDVGTEGFTIEIGVERNAVSAASPDAEVLAKEDGEPLPLVEKKFLNIKDYPAYRVQRKLAKGASDLNGETNGLTRTTVTYRLRSGNDVFTFWLQVDSEQPESVMTNFDKLVETFSVL